MPITSSDGKKSKRRKVSKPRGNWEVTRMLMGLLTGNKKEALSAMKVHANRYGSTGSVSRVTKLYTIGVKMKAVASLESSMEMRLPSRKVLKKRRRELLPESRAAWTASQSKSPAASASAARLIIPRKKKKVFQSRSKVARASLGLRRPRRSRAPAPVSA